MRPCYNGGQPSRGSQGFSPQGAFPMHWLSLFVLAAPPAESPGWMKEESAHLKNIRQITFDFNRAGEAYFSPDGKQIVFQAEEKDSGNPFYQIFMMDLEK